jgi:CYTH domain-containing protein
MNRTRCFVVAPSLARLIENERGAHRLTEGFFPEKTDRSIYVRVGSGANELVLVERSPDGEVERAVPLSPNQAIALLELAASRVEYRQATLELRDLTVIIRRLTTPGLINLATIEFDHEEQARAFEPPPWLGAEVAKMPEYQHRRIAFHGQPEIPEVEISDMALHNLLDVLEGPSAIQEASIIAPRSLKSPSQPVEEAHSSDRDEADGGGTEIEDDVIRELARSLQPTRR